MLSETTLRRVSVSFCRGYQDGSRNRGKFLAVRPEYIKPFADHDYNEGYAAGVNDAKVGNPVEALRLATAVGEASR